MGQRRSRQKPGDEMKREEFEAMRDWWVEFAAKSFHVHRTPGIALAVHTANAEFRQALGEPPGLSFADNLASLLSGIESIEDDPSLTPEYSHDLWWQVKISDGWEYGPELDKDRKTHPNMVHYADLPEEQKWKDELFGSIVRAGLGI